MFEPQGGGPSPHNLLNKILATFIYIYIYIYRDGDRTDQDRIMGNPNSSRTINIWLGPTPPRWSRQPTPPCPWTAPPHPTPNLQKNTCIPQLNETQTSKIQLTWVLFNKHKQRFFALNWFYPKYYDYIIIRTNIFVILLKIGAGRANRGRSMPIPITAPPRWSGQKSCPVPASPPLRGG